MKGPIVVLGGGTAGWLGALFFKNRHPNEDVVVVESEEMGVVGVGEGSTPYLHDLFQMLNINILDIIQEAGMAFKNGAFFYNWDDKNKNFPHSFNIIDNNFYNCNEELISHFLTTNNPDLFRAINPLYDISMEKKVSKIVNGLPEDDFSFHFDALLMAKTLKRISLSRGIKWVEGKAIDIEMLNDNVKSLILEDGRKVEGNFFVDCSGFHRFFPKKLGIKYEEFDDLMVDSAIPYTVKGVYFDPFTECRAMNYGWEWFIPTLHRAGTGYVYSSKYVSDDQARDEFIRHIKRLTSYDIDPQKIIRFKSGMLEKLYYKNVLSLGLSAHFLEPLEATSIIITALTLFEFDKRHSREIFNLNTRKRILQIKDFIVLHYLTRKTNTQFWIDASKKARENEFIASLIEDIKERKQISLNVFKDNDNYFGFINHFIFLQKYGIVDGPLKLKDYNFTSISPELLRHFTAWHNGKLETAVSYRDYYIKFL